MFGETTSKPRIDVGSRDERSHGLQSDILATNPAMSTAKEQVESLLHKLPENCSLEDIQYHLYVLDKVRHGLEEAEQQGTISQDDVEKRLSQWLTE
ncbi:MAG: hypothetical protein WA261_21650 [Candidatus Sulfotelmatobacter sp.]